MASEVPPEEMERFNAVVQGGVLAQRLVPGSVAVGGTAAALYAGHRISLDVDHVVVGLRDNFDAILESLHASPEWRTNRIQRPVLILGRIGDVEIGFRQPIRTTAIETARIATRAGELVVPTLDEIIGIKAYLAYARNALRDYLDFAALATTTDEGRVLNSLLKLDDRYAGVQAASVRLEVAKALAAAAPYDLEGTDLSRYRALTPEWRDWSRTAGICRRIGVLLGEKLLEIDRSCIIDI